MNQTCDLHTHSVFSDGTYTPTQLIEEAQQTGLSAIALTDHNTVAGLPEFLHAAEGTDLEAIPGVEFSTDYRDLDLHMVALYVMPDVFPQVRQLMEDGDRRKEQSNQELAAALGKAGYPIDYDAIRAATPNGHVNRAHIAAEMIKRGYVSSIREAFDTLLEPKCGYYHPPKRPDTFFMIDFIRSIGAVSVLAHPFLKLNEPQLRELLQQACPCGLNGMETLYATFDRETTEKAISLAGEFHLLQSGGSDFHGLNKPDLRLGVGRGNLAVPLEFRDKLKAAAGK